MIISVAIAAATAVSGIVSPTSPVTISVGGQIVILITPNVMTISTTPITVDRSHLSSKRNNGGRWREIDS